MADPLFDQRRVFGIQREIAVLHVSGARHRMPGFVDREGIEPSAEVRTQHAEGKQCEQRGGYRERAPASCHARAVGPHIVWLISNHRVSDSMLSNSLRLQGRRSGASATMMSCPITRVRHAEPRRGSGTHA